MSTTPAPTTPSSVIATTGHVGISVVDIDRSTSWYQEVFGLDVIGSAGEGDHRYAFLGADGTLVLTLWQQATAAFDPSAAGLHHLSFEVPAVDDVRAAERRLHELGAAFAYDGVVPHGEGADSGGIFFHDPDGTRLEIYTRSGAGESSAPSVDGPTCGFF